MATSLVILKFKSVHEILWCNNSNENSSAEILTGAISFLPFYAKKFDLLKISLPIIRSEMIRKRVHLPHGLAWLTVRAAPINDVIRKASRISLA